MRWMMLGAVTGLFACGPRAVETPTATSPRRPLIDYFDVISTVADDDSVKQRRASAFATVNAAGVRLASIDVGPRHLEVFAGEDLDLMRAMQVVGRDSAGRVVEGWAPYFLSSDAYFARTDELVLMAFAPGTVEVFVRPTVLRDTLRRIFPPLSPVTGSTSVVIKAPPFAPTPTTPSPREALQAYTAALNAEQWAEAARHVHHPGFARYVNTRIAAFKPPPGP